MQEREPVSPAERSEVFWSWVASISFHAVVGTLVVLILVFWARKSSGVDRTTIIIPNSFDDPAYSEHPSGAVNPGAGDPMRDAAQGLKQLAKSEGWSESKGQDLSQLTGSSAENDAVGIFAGSGASIGTGKDGNAAGSSMAAYGTPGGGFGNGPRSSFYGTGGNAMRIVYLIDHTGSLIEMFGSKLGEPGTIKGEVNRSISALIPLQYFSIVVFTAPSDGGVEILSSLVTANSSNKKDILGKFEEVVPKGGEGDAEFIFINGFRAAFSQQPELIYFLTDGDVSQGVTEELRKLNRDKKIKINVIMISPNPINVQDREDELRLGILTQLAKENGGTAKVVSAMK